MLQPLLAAFLVLTSIAWSNAAERFDPLIVPPETAPPLEKLAVGEVRQLGRWDDAFAVPDADVMVLRRQQELFRLALGTSAEPELWFEAPETSGSEMLAGLRLGDELWVFFNSSQRAPFALELTKRSRLDFEVPGFQTGDRPATIQSLVIVPHEGAAVLMISGGEKEHWPRPGNRPVYFWAGLKGSKLRQLPVGWDLEYFSEDQGVAVFAKPQEERFKRRSLIGQDLATGMLLDRRIPDRRKDHWVPFDWSDQHVDKPVFAARQTANGDLNRLVGVSSGGRVVPFDTVLAQQHVHAVQVRDDWVAIYLRDHGQPRPDAQSLWLAPFQPDAKPLQVARGVTGFENLGQGRCLFRTFSAADNGREGVFVYDSARVQAWDVREGIEGLKPLPEDHPGSIHFEDKLTVRLVSGLGSVQQPDKLGLAIVTHSQLSVAAIPYLHGAIPRPTPLTKISEINGEVLKLPQLWRRTFLITPDGDRFETDLWRELPPPDLVWLHNSGTLVTGSHVWTGPDSNHRRVAIESRQILLSDSESSR